MGEVRQRLSGYAGARGVLAGSLAVVAVALLAFGAASLLDPGDQDGQPSVAQLSAPVELTAERTATTKTFDNPAGTRTVRLYAAPVHYRDEAGEWRDIDPVLKERDGALVAGGVPFAASLGASADAPVDLEGGLIVARALDAREVEAKVSEDTAVYENAYEHTDLVRTLTPGGVKQDYVLHAPGHPDTFRESVDSSLAMRLEEDGSISYLDGEDKTAFSPRPFLEDAEGARVDLDYVIDGSALTLSLPDLSELTYPITVDPSVILVHASGPQDDGWIRWERTSYDWGQTWSEPQWTADTTGRLPAYAYYTDVWDG